MPRTTRPKLRSNSRGYAFVEIAGKRTYLGYHVEDRRATIAYERFLLTNGFATEDPVTVGELCEKFMDHARVYYRKRGKTTSEFAIYERIVFLLRGWFDDLPATEFGPEHLEAFREALIVGRVPPGRTKPRRPMARSTINAFVSKTVHIFRWAVKRRLVRAEIYTALRTVESLPARRSAARETEAVRPVPVDQLRATLEHMEPEAATLVRFQLLTGCRPGEQLVMRPCDIDRTNPDVWYFTVPSEHDKTAHHGSSEPIAITPAAMDLIRDRLDREPTERIFSRYADVGAYRNAIYRACDRAAPEATEHLRRKRVPTTGRKSGTRWESAAEHRARIGGIRWEEYCEWRAAQRWHPHRLRHNSATTARKQGGIELARRVMRHRSVRTTENYACPDNEIAATFKGIDPLRDVG